MLGGLIKFGIATITTALAFQVVDDVTNGKLSSAVDGVKKVVKDAIDEAKESSSK
ncbi:MAG: hypothetical protein KAS32_11110 [Candidatus Peribacteraceae bacterium]|nr:hypothetical protein [Candidatus Peribacteraceae bacterium]